MKNLSDKKALAPWMKIAATGGILLGAAAIVGSGAFAVWTSSATADAAITAGAIKIDLTNSNITATGMAPGDTIEQLLPISFTQAANSGDLVTCIKLFVTASNDTLGVNPSTLGTAGFNDGSGSSLFTGSVASTKSTVAYPDGTSGLGADLNSSALTYKISTCANEWTQTAPGAAYTCDVTPTVTAIAGTDLNTIQALTPLTLTPTSFGVTGSPTTFPSDNVTVSLHSMISITLPSTANNSFEKASVKLTFSASVIQRNGITTAP